MPVKSSVHYSVYIRRRSPAKSWVEDMVRFFDVDRSDAKKHAAETAAASLCNYLTDEIKSRVMPWG